MRRIQLAALIVAVAIGTGAHAQSKPAGPWDPDLEAAAERAVARLGPKRALEIRAEVRSIPMLAPSAAP